MGQLKQLDVLSWELKHKSFKIVFVGCGVCVLFTLFAVQTAGRLLLTISAVLGTVDHLKSRPCCEPSAMTKQAVWLPLVWTSPLFMGLIACSSSSLGDEMFELLGQITDVVQRSWEKGKRKEN